MASARSQRPWPLPDSSGMRPMNESLALAMLAEVELDHANLAVGFIEH